MGSRFTSLLLFVGVLLLGLVPRALFISRTSPYPLHEDEGLIAVPAERMLRRGELNPHWFKYPSLPIYLTAASLAAGRVLEGDTEADVGNVGQPFYSRPQVVETARLFFALLSVAVLALVGLLGVTLTGERALLFLAPLALLVSDRFLIQSWTYLNVDIVGAAVCTGALAYAFRTQAKASLVHRALLPGLLTGLAVGSKYYLGLVGLPFAMLLFDRRYREHWLRNSAAIVAATVLGFLLSTPYALLDRETFVEHVLFEVEHYQEGHAGGEAEPGLEQLVYYGEQLAREFGYGLLAFALIGLVSLVKRDPRSALVFLAFPVSLLAFLVMQRVHFPRNMLSIYALVPILSAYGIISTSRGLAERFALAGRPGLAPLGPVFVIAALALSLPFRRIRASYSIPADSRNRAVEWVREHRLPGSRVLVAAELQLDPRGLEQFRVTELPLTELVEPGMIARHADDPPVFLLPNSRPGSRFARTYAELMQPTEELALKAEFGRNPLPRRTTRLIHMGDPRLRILALPVEVSMEGEHDRSSH